ncbi:MAG TPA: phosphatase PAP2 family protein [Ktedonobacteraceae bacterium]|nr:phosphatase PAP2 family protein [Ktedonobacteraceae bacterium]
MSQRHIKEQTENNVEGVLDRVEQEVARTKEPWYSVSSRRARIFVVIYLVEFVLFALLAWFVHVHPVVPVDVTITREFQENRSPWLSISMIIVSAFGSIPLLMPAVILITALIFWRFRLRLEALFIVGLSVVSLLLNFLIKLVVDRPRPSASLVEIIQKSGGLSFPSGHVMSYVAFWGLLFSFGIILFKRDRWWHYGLLIVPALFVVLIGPSRIYVGDHWASDVLGGYLFGGLLLGVGLWIYLRLKSNGVLQSKK